MSPTAERLRLSEDGRPVILMTAGPDIDGALGHHSQAQCLAAMISPQLAT